MRASKQPLRFHNIRLRPHTGWQPRLLAPFLLLLLCAPLIFNYSTQITNPDSGLYLAEGLNLAAKGEYSALGDAPDIMRPPLLPLLLAAAYKLFGVSEQAALLIIKLFGLIAIAAYYAIGECFFGRLVGFIAGILIATSSYLTFYLFGAIMLDGPQAAMFGCFLFFLLSGFQTGKLKHFLFSGLSLAAGFAIKESAIIWALLPIFSLLLVKQYGKKQSIKGLTVLYLPFALVSGVWWLYVYRLSGTIYLISSGRAPVLRNLNDLASPAAIAISLLLAVVVLAAVGVAVRTSILDKLMRRIPWGQVGFVFGWVLLLAYLGVAGSLPAADRYAGYFDLYIRRMLNENPAGYLVLPAWIIFVFVFRRSAPARVFLIFFALTIPMITLLLVWRYQPRNLIPLFMLSAVVVAAVTVAGARYLIRVATPRSPRVRLGLWPAAIVLLTGGIVFLTWNSQIRYSLASSYGAAEVVITGEPCAQWLREHAPSESSIAITALYDEAFYFLMDGVQFEVHPIYPQNSFFTLTEDGHLFTKNKIYIGRRPGAAPEQRPYQYLDEDIWLRTLQENNIDFYVFEGTTNVVVAPFAGQRYFDRHPGLQLVCTDSSPSVVTAVYKVNQAMLGSLNATYLDRQALSALEADATAQAELLNRSQLLDAIGKQVSVVSPVEIELAVTYQHMADVYRETGSQDLAQFYATRAAVYDPTTVDAAQEATLVRYWTDNLANDGWSAAALAAYYGAKALSAEAAAVYSNAVNNLNQDYDLYSALNGRLAQFGTIATRIELAQAALAAWPTDNTAFATLMALQLANKDQYAAQLTQMRWLAVQENDAPIYQRIAQLYVQAQELQMGESVLLEAYHRWPENGNLVLSLADLYTAQGRHDKAAELLTDSLRTIADDDQLYGKLVEVYLALNDIGAAEQVLSAWQPASSSKYQSLLQISLQQMQEAATLNVDHWLDAQ